LALTDISNFWRYILRCVESVLESVASAARNFSFWLATVFCMGYRLSKHETRYSENVGVSSPLTTPMVGVVFEDRSTVCWPCGR